MTDRRRIIERRRLEVTPYDTDLTILYKTANIFEVPISLISILPRSDAEYIDDEVGTEDMVYKDTISFVGLLMQREIPFDEAYALTTAYNQNITLDIMMMIYFHVIYLSLRGDIPDDLYEDFNVTYQSINPNIDRRYADNVELRGEHTNWLARVRNELANDTIRLNEILTAEESFKEMEKVEDDLYISELQVTSSIYLFEPSPVESLDVPNESGDNRLEEKRSTRERSTTSSDRREENEDILSRDRRSRIRDTSKKTDRPSIDMSFVGIDIFNEMIATKHVSFIQYNSTEGTSYFKTFNPETLSEQPSYSNIRFTQEASSRDTIYIRYWAGDLDGNTSISKATLDTLVLAAYSLSKNRLSVNVPSGRKFVDASECFRRIQDSISVLDMGVGREVKITAHFDFYGFDLNDYALADLTMSDPVIRTYLFMDDSNRLSSLKKNFTLNFRAAYESEAETRLEESLVKKSVTVTLSERESSGSSRVRLDDGTVLSVPGGTRVMHCKILQAQSRSALTSFMRVFKLLIRRYLTLEDNIREIYTSAYEPLHGYELTLDFLYTTDGARVTKTSATIDLDDYCPKLSEYAPEIFVPGYASICPCNSQPEVIDTEERYNELTDNGSDIMAFPNNEPEIWLHCPIEGKSIVGVKSNLHLPNRDKYPYLPCCFTDRSSTHGNKYDEYMLGVIPQRQYTAKSTVKITTNRPLAEGRIAFIPRGVEKVLGRYSPTANEVGRYGVRLNNNSMIDAVLLAIEDERYMGMMDEELSISELERDNYVKMIRESLRDRVYPGLMKQQMYDYTDSEILGAISDSTTFFDSDLYYRALEELFNVNIYVFTTDNKTEKDIGSISIPRFRNFYTRAPRMWRYTVVLLKIPHLDTYHYELVVDHNVEENTIIKLFGEEMTNICHLVTINSLRSLLFSSSHVDGTGISSASTYVSSNVSSDLNTSISNTNLAGMYNNMFYRYDYLDKFNMRPIAQYIDYEGKMRGLVFEIDERNVSIAVIPSQPENLPVTRTVYQSTYDVATSILGEPSGYTVGEDGLVNGLWFPSLDVTYSHYIPIESIDVDGGQPTSLIPFIVSNGQSNVSRESVIKIIKKRSRAVNIFIQLLRYVYCRNITLSPVEMYDRYVTLESTSLTEDEIYNFSNLRRRLPAVTTPDDAIEYLSTVVPTLFRASRRSGDTVLNNNRIIVYDEDLYLKIRQLFILFDKTEEKKPLDGPVYLVGYYEDVTDFTQHPDEKIFIGNIELENWLRSNRTIQDHSLWFTITDVIYPSAIDTKDPYLHRDTQGRIFLIQNVSTGTFNKALYVSYLWLTQGYNAGDLDRYTFKDEDFTIMDDLSYTIYGVTSSGELSAIKQVKRVSDKFFPVLYYGMNLNKAGTNNYASLLQLI